jgi:hypothetical protein
MGFFDAFVPVRPVAVTAGTNDIDASLAPLYPEASPFFAITGTAASRAANNCTIPGHHPNSCIVTDALPQYCNGRKSTKPACD